MISKKSSRSYCKDDISKVENYDKAIADTTQTWHLHHRLELTLEGEQGCSQETLIRMNMYYKRPYFELIFLSPKEHSDLHKLNKPHKHKGGFQSESKRHKISNAHKGVKRGPLSEKHKKNLSKALKGRIFTEEWKKKISEAKRK